MYADGRDRWSLLRPSTVNRRLEAQGRGPRGDGRLLLGQGRFSGWIDGMIGWQAPIREGQQTRFHGYYVLDTYVELRVIDQIALNLNFTIFNPSASDGYRTSADILTGFTIDVHETFTLWDRPLQVDILGFDLDVLTTGVGLFFEQLPVEGWMIGARYNGAEFRMTWGGRALFSDDNFLFAEASLFDGRAGLTYMSWFGDLTENEITPETLVDAFHAIYIGAFVDTELFDGIRVGAEYAGRLDTGSLRSSAMARIDWRSSGKIFGSVRWQAHVGYQARLYLNEFGPRGLFVEPTQTPNTPRREDIYVTNSFEYFQYTPFFDQWSHTGMFELNVRPHPYLRFFAHTEVWYRALEAKAPRVINNLRFGRFPGDHLNFFYRCGAEFYPFPSLPHRFTAYVTNKAVVAVTDVRTALPDRLDHRDFYYIEGVFQL